MTHPVVYAIGLGFALGAAVYMYFAQEHQTHNHHANYRFNEAPIRPARPTTPNRTDQRRRNADEICTICFESITTGWKTLSCSHSFHVACLNPLAEKKCPNCRKEF